MSNYADRIRRLEDLDLSAGLKLKLQLDAGTIEFLEQALAQGLTPEQLAVQWEKEFEEARNRILQAEHERERAIIASGNLKEIRHLGYQKGWKVTCQYGVLKIDRNPDPTHKPRPRRLKGSAA